jgi:diguanylate cyclase (GGDEF)-like protein
MDQLYRIGGEEFAVILAQTDLETAMDLAERLREAVAAQPIAHRDDTITVTVSVGVARFTENRAPAETLDAADAALYRAKSGGRNRVAAGE